MRNSRKRKTNVRKKQSCSNIKKSVGSNVHALQEKFKHILGCKQPIVMLERCSILKNISHPNCLQVSLKNSINNTCNANDTRKLVHSTNHVSHQSPCVENTNLASEHNFEVEPTVKKINNSSSKFPSTTNVFENVSQISRTCSKRAASSKHKSIPKIDKRDSTSSLDKIMGGQLQKNNLNESVAKPQECNTNTAADAVKSCKRIKIYKRTSSSSIDTASHLQVSSSSEDLNIIPLQERLAIKESTMSEDKASFLSTGNSRSSTLTLQSLEKLKAIQLQEKLIELQKKLVPSSNKLRKLTKKCTVAHTQKNTITNDTEGALSASTSSFIHSSANNTVQYSERFIVPSSNELSKPTKLCRLAHTRKSTREDTLSASTRNFINSSTNAVQSSDTLAMRRSNDSNKKIKESTVVNIEKNIKVKEKINEENNVEHDASHHQCEQRSLRGQKRVHSASSSISQDVKKVKLNRVNWHKRLEAVTNAVDTSKEVDRTEKIVELKNHEKISQLIHTDVPGPSIEFPEGVNITCGVQVAQARNEERGVSSIEKQTLTETFGYSNKVDCNAQTDARKSEQKVATENHIPVSKNTSFFSENRYFHNSASQGDEDDCISLFADSALIDEYNIPEAPQSRRSQEAPLVTEKQYLMTDKVIDNYYRKNALEFNEAYNVNYSNNSKTQIVSQKKKPDEIVMQKKKPIKIVPQREKPVKKIVLKTRKPVEIVSKTKKPVGIVPETKKTAEISPLMEINIQAGKDVITRLTPNTQTLTNTRTVNHSNRNGLFTLFRGFCYKMLKTGACYVNTCNYAHNYTHFLMEMYQRNETCFFEVIDDLIQQQYKPFLESFYQMCSRNVRNLVCSLKLLKKFCALNAIKSHIAYDSIKEVIMRGVTVNQIVDILVTIVDASDTQFVTSISKILVNYIEAGNGWPTLKPLFMRIDKLDQDIIEIILAECILTQQHVQDVYENVVRKLENESFGLQNKKLAFIVDQFHSIHRRIQENATVEEKVASTSVSIASPNPLNEPDIIPYTVRTDKLSPKVWKNVCFDSNNNVRGGNTLALLHPIDNVPSPYSKRSRERFWKFYLDVHSLQEGLKHNDYKHVKKIMDEAEIKQTSRFTTACYNILQRTVQHSQIHLSKLASLAVQDGATATFFKILIDVTIYILADMAERELWVLALLLLRNMEGILHEQSSFLKFDAVVTMLFCEIYLANRKPMKAYNLLKQSNILYTHRGKWKVRNNEKDDNIRAQRVTILLDMFCDTSPENAFNLFKFLIEDQSSNFYPIDLTYQANRVVSSLLLRNDHESIIEIAKLIDSYNYTLHPITYRALISSLVRIDLPLAKQMYQSAVLLGIYPEMQFSPVMYVIVQSDWTSEEMYLAIWAMLRKLLENLGHAIEGVKQHNLSSYLVFETTLSDTQLVNDMETKEQYENKIEKSINLMKKVLKTEFHPPLCLVKNRKGKFQKMSCQSLCKYLKCNPMNGMQYV